MTEAELAAIADRVVALLAPRLERIEAALGQLARSVGASTRATGRIREQVGKLTTAVSSLAAASIDDEPDTGDEAVHGAVVDLKVNAIRKTGGLLDDAFAAPGALVRGLAAAPGALLRVMAANRWATGATLAAVGGLLLQLADGAPFMVALGRAFIALGTGGLTPPSTGSAP